jgi:protein SCO1/2
MFANARSFIAATLAVAALVSGGCSKEAETSTSTRLRLDVEAASTFRGDALAEFTLTDQLGRSVTRADLAGAPVVLDFIFTTCTGPCPRVSAHMSLVQERTAGSKISLASFSVDPETDTPEVLKAYSEEHHADPQRWRFLTGAEEQIDAVLRSLWLARSKSEEAALGMHVTHSTRLIVLDARGAVRGMYDGESEQGVDAAVARARWLLEHPDA